MDERDEGLTEVKEMRATDTGRDAGRVEEERTGRPTAPRGALIAAIACVLIATVVFFVAAQLKRGSEGNAGVEGVRPPASAGIAAGDEPAIPEVSLADPDVGEEGAPGSAADAKETAQPDGAGDATLPEIEIVATSSNTDSASSNPGSTNTSGQAAPAPAAPAGGAAQPSGGDTPDTAGAGQRTDAAAAGTQAQGGATMEGISEGTAQRPASDAGTGTSPSSGGGAPVADGGNGGNWQDGQVTSSGSLPSTSPSTSGFPSSSSSVGGTSQGGTSSKGSSDSNDTRTPESTQVGLDDTQIDEGDQGASFEDYDSGSAIMLPEIPL